MALKKTKITIDQAGNIHVDSTGFTGNACSVETQHLLANLGAETKSEQKKPEFFQKSGTVQKNTW